MRNEILVYDDEGTGPDSLSHLKNCLTSHFGTNHIIKCVNASDILQSNWQENCKIICFCGGFDLGYLRKLEEKGCGLIRDFVLKGGIYVGICAGAYFASNYIEFDKGGPLEVVGERHLKFFNGMAFGPIFPGFDYKAHAGIHACEIYDNNVTGNRLRVMYRGGCAFSRCEDDNDASILYKYAINDEAAIIHTKCGEGQALLSGVHFEYNFYDIDFELTSDVKEKLQSFHEARLQLVNDLFKKLGID